MDSFQNPTAEPSSQQAAEYTQKLVQTMDELIHKMKHGTAQKPAVTVSAGFSEPKLPAEAQKLWANCKKEKESAPFSCITPRMREDASRAYAAISGGMLPEYDALAEITRQMVLHTHALLDESLRFQTEISRLKKKCDTLTYELIAFPYKGRHNYRTHY